ncbi:glycosyltransferase [Rhizobium yanglingense]
MFKHTGARYLLGPWAHCSALLSNHELLGKAILEACAPHKPVVSSRSEGPSCANGLFAEIGDVDSFAKAIERLINDPVLAAKLAATRR